MLYREEEYFDYMIKMIYYYMMMMPGYYGKAKVILMFIYYASKNCSILSIGIMQVQCMYIILDSFHNSNEAGRFLNKPSRAHANISVI